PGPGGQLGPAFRVAGETDVARACEVAAAAFASYARTSPETRAAFLRAIAEGLERDGAAIAARAHDETALPLPRLQNELARTCNQLRLFADVVEEGSWVDARIDANVRSMRRPLGPVV